MNRIEFGNRLSSVVIRDGTTVAEINRLVLPIREAIEEMLPQSLFRYRACTDKHIDAFENDRVFAVPADLFNDPYDTLVKYDYEGIKEYVEAMVSIDGLQQMKEYFAQGNGFPPVFKQVFPIEFWDELKARILQISDFKGLEDRLEECKRQLLSLVAAYFPILSFFGKRFSTIACFSEDVQSILMWSHYADSHKGFALEYDFRPTLMRPLPRVGLFPVIYSEERFDASAFLAWGMFTILGIKSINPDILASIKAALYKSKSWEYEKEWRMIDPGPHDIMNPTPSVIEYPPTAIYYGKSIEEGNRNRLHSIAVSKGIKEYKMIIDPSSPLYEMRFRQV